MGEERVNTHKGLSKNKKTAILKLISKLSEKTEMKEETKSKVEALLEEAKEKREQSLQSDDKEDIILLRLENKRRKKHKTLKRRPLRRKSHIVVLPGDYLVSSDLLPSYDDYDYDDYDDYVEEVPLFNERVRSSLTGRLSSAEKRRKNIKRKVRKLLSSSL